jgi:hypothetical protein
LNPVRAFFGSDDVASSSRGRLGAMAAGVMCLQQWFPFVVGNLLHDNGFVRLDVDKNRPLARISLLSPITDLPVRLIEEQQVGIYDLTAGRKFSA